MTLSSLWHTVYPVLIAILFFELIILVHEGGHYFAARLMKIKVNEFSVGMGPKIIQRERNGTKFSLRWILFGGYCQMEGEGEDSEDPNAFNKKSVPARLFVVVAGALMNLVLGFLLTVLIVCGSNLIGTAQVAKFEANAASAASGPPRKRAPTRTATVPFSMSPTSVAAASFLLPVRRTLVAPILPEPMLRRSGPPESRVRMIPKGMEPSR